MDYMTTPQLLAHNVQELMEARGWSQGKLAMLMGRRRPWVNDFLNNKGVPSLAVLDEFAAVFGVKVKTLLRERKVSRISA